MAKEFNLSDKQKHASSGYSSCYDEDCKICVRCYDEIDVKDFIKKLKEEVRNELNDIEGIIINALIKRIDKLSGEKLI
jgi:hypothetical protein